MVCLGSSGDDAAEDGMTRTVWDVVIVGAGPAGLSAALVLGRACRKVLLCDTGTPRSWASKEMHCFLTRDGVAPSQFRRIAHQQLARYDNVVFRNAEVTRASRTSSGRFKVMLGKKQHVSCRKLLIATGLFDHLPNLEGIERFFGTSVFQCPYCDGWEWRNAPVAVYGKRKRGFEMARALTAWTHDLVLCTDGLSPLSAIEKEQLRRNGIQLVEERIARLEGVRVNCGQSSSVAVAHLPAKRCFLTRVERTVESCGVARLPVRASWWN